jgi:AcrR family transcriptional regulator
MYGSRSPAVAATDEENPQASLELGQAAPPETPCPPKPRRSYLPADERRRQIILAAQEVFARTNLQGARTRDLAKAAGINQATLFEHFDSKEDLFVAAVVQPMLDVMRGMRERLQAIESVTSPEDMLAMSQASTENYLKTMVDIYPLLAVALFSDPALGQKLYCEQIAPLLKERGEAMRSLVKGNVDPEILSLAAFGMLFAVAMDRAFTGKTDNLSALARQIASLVAFGFARDRESD